jgi:hypothetical protein
MLLTMLSWLRANEKSAQEDKFKTGLYAGKAYLTKGRYLLQALKEFDYTIPTPKLLPLPKLNTM